VAGLSGTATASRATSDIVRPSTSARLQSVPGYGLTVENMDWVPDECTLPTADRPLRTAQFREVFGELTRTIERVAPGRLRLALVPSPEVAGRVAELAVRETECCSFFEFTLTAGKGLSLEIAVPEGREAILDAMAGSL